VAVVSLVGVFIQSRRAAHAYDQIKHELEVLSMLPEDSEMSPLLQAQVERSLRALLEHRSAKGRDWSGVGVAIFFAGFASALAFPMLNGGWWWLLGLLVAPAAFLGIFGLFDSLMLADRDAMGRRVNKPPDEPDERASGTRQSEGQPSRSE